MDETSEPLEIPPQLVWLKRLVIVLTVVMIAGFALMIGALVVKLTADPVPVPERLTLPEGTRASAYTQGDGWAAVVTQDGRILVYDQLTGALLREIDVR